METETNAINELIGKYVKFSGDGLDITGGELYEIEDVSPPDFGYARDTIAVYDDAGDYHRFEYPVVDYEVVEDEVEPLAEGDHVQLLKGGGYTPLLGFKDGGVYKVESIDSNMDWEEGIVVQLAIEQSNIGYAGLSQVKKVADKTSREFLEGDIVRIKEYQSGFDAGTIVEVASLSCTSKSVVTRGIQDRFMRDWYLASASCIELVAPVDARVDRVE